MTNKKNQVLGAGANLHQFNFSTIEQIKELLTEYIAEDYLTISSLTRNRELNFSSYCNLVSTQFQANYGSYALRRERLITANPKFLLKELPVYSRGQVGILFMDQAYIFKNIQHPIVRVDLVAEYDGQVNQLALLWLKKDDRWWFLFANYLK